MVGLDLPLKIGLFPFVFPPPPSFGLLMIAAWWDALIRLPLLIAGYYAGWCGGGGLHLDSPVPPLCLRFGFSLEPGIPLS